MGYRRIISSSCGWCHESNPVERQYCHNCGHEAHKARMFCECIQCATQVQGTIYPLDVADLMARVNLSDEEFRKIMEQYGIEIQEDDDDR